LRQLYRQNLNQPENRVMVVVETASGIVEIVIVEIAIEEIAIVIGEIRRIVNRAERKGRRKVEVVVYHQRIKVVKIVVVVVRRAEMARRKIEKEDGEAEAGIETVSIVAKAKIENEVRNGGVTTKKRNVVSKQRMMEKMARQTWNKQSKMVLMSCRRKITTKR